jgi:hypothetical protein
MDIIIRVEFFFKAAIVHLCEEISIITAEAMRFHLKFATRDLNTPAFPSNDSSSSPTQADKL